MTFLFAWFDLTAFQLKLMYNALFSDRKRDDLKEMKRELRTIREKLKSHLTSGEEGIHYFYMAILLDSTKK